MQFVEHVTGLVGYYGKIPIARAVRLPGRGQWDVEVLHKAHLRAYSRKEVRHLMAVHGADRVEMTHAVKVIRSDPAMALSAESGFCAPKLNLKPPTDKNLCLPDPIPAQPYPVYKIWRPRW